MTVTLLYVPTLELTLGSVKEIDVVPLPAASPLIVIFWLPFTIRLQFDTVDAIGLSVLPIKPPTLLKVFDEFNNLALLYEKTNIGRIMQQIVSSNQFDIHDDPYINRYIFMTILYSYVADVDDIIITMISLLKFSNRCKKLVAISSP